MLAQYTGPVLWKMGGISLIITPIAMVICMLAVMRRKNVVAEQARREAEAAGLIWKAGDL